MKALRLITCDWPSVPKEVILNLSDRVNDY
jgi:hypothetical protein